MPTKKKTILASYFVVSTNLRSNFEIELFFIFAQKILFTQQHEENVVDFI